MGRGANHGAAHHGSACQARAAVGSEPALAKVAKPRYGLTATAGFSGGIVSEREMATKDEERAARLKAALRDNLRRRKAQARGRVEDAPDAAPAVDAEPATNERSAGKT